MEGKGSRMYARFKIVGIGLVIAGIVFAGVGGYTYMKTQQGAHALAAFSALVFMAQPENFAIFQPIVLGALWLGPRPEGRHPVVRAAGGLLVGLAMLARNDGDPRRGALGCCSRGPASGPGGPRRPRRCRGRPPVGCARPVPARHGAVVGSPARGLRLDLADVRVRRAPVDPISEWNSITADPTLGALPRPGQRPDRRRAGSPGSSGRRSATSSSSSRASSWCRSWSSAAGSRRQLDGLRGRGSSTPSSCSPFAALVSRSTSPAARSSTRRSGWRRTPYDPRRRGGLVAVGWIAPAGARLGGDRPRGVFVWGVVAIVVAIAVVFAPRSRRLGSRRGERRAVAAALDRARAPRPDDRIMSIDAAGIEVLDRPAAAWSTPDDPIDTIEAVARGLRHPLAGRSSATTPWRPLAPVLEPGRPTAWIGPPAFAVPAADGGMPTLAPSTRSARRPDDTRCALTASGAAP